MSFHLHRHQVTRHRSIHLSASILLLQRRTWRKTTTQVQGVVFLFIFFDQNLFALQTQFELFFSGSIFRNLNGYSSRDWRRHFEFYFVCEYYNFYVQNLNASNQWVGSALFVLTNTEGGNRSGVYKNQIFQDYESTTSVAMELTQFSGDKLSSNRSSLFYGSNQKISRWSLATWCIQGIYNVPRQS